MSDIIYIHEDQIMVPHNEQDYIIEAKNIKYEDGKSLYQKLNELSENQ